MLIPIKHENMAARRLPIVTVALIVINVAVFLGTYGEIENNSRQLGTVRAHILMLAAMHPELDIPAGAAQSMVDSFKHRSPELWSEMQQPNRSIADAWDAQTRLKEKPDELQEEMNSLAGEYAQLAGTSVLEKYAFIPAHPQALAYLTANFLHGGWLHIIGNMWFLWLAGFVLEDAWGRPLYTAFYLIAGAAALQFHAWMNSGSLTPTLGASGAVAALMGAFLVRFPKMRIEMMWLLNFRSYRFKAPAYSLLPLWLLMEVFYGSLFGSASGTAHWAHVGGFVFGALAALAIQHSGLEQKANAAIEAEVAWENDPEIVRAMELADKNEFDASIAILQNFTTAKPASLDGWNLLRQTYWKKNDIPSYQHASVKLCELHLKAKQNEAAWEAYQDFLKAGGVQLPAALWMDVCRMLEAEENYEPAREEYEKLAAAYPMERQSLLAYLAAGKLCLKKLNRPQDALKFFQAAGASPIPHLDYDLHIQTGMREANAALAMAKSATAGA